ncbi:MAG TPA: trigger factor [Acidimicrobiales bacterium]|nr:trigger factor [Acidimicrobiales bacterium]
MKAAVEPLEGNKVKLSIEVEEDEFEKAIDAAFRKIAREVRVPGFRPGKAPRRILEARFGKEAGRAEALRDSLPGYYSQALREHDVDAIAPPEIDITAGEESGSVAFDAVVEVRPQLKLAGYQGLRVEIPSPEVTAEEIDAQVDRLRSNFGELKSVERPARDGDHLTIDLKGSRDGEEVTGLTTDDFLYELGSGTVLPELDEQLQGAKVGDILSFEADLPGGKVEFKVLVKDVKEKVLPEVTDEWASEASEFDTVDELRADITKRIGMVKKVQATIALRNSTIDALVELVDIDAPAPLVDEEVQRRVHDLEHRLQAQNASVAEYLEATGQTPEQVIESMREGAAAAVKADLALRAVAEAEQIEPTDEDLDAEIGRLAESYRVKPAELRRNLDRADQMPAVRSDWKKTRALEWLLERVEIVDQEGHPIDRALLQPESPEEPSSPEDPTAPETPAAETSPDDSEAETAEK